ncbi:MAG: ABC transporter ATP-binding protein [Clostridia bacterium]|nr:ABC transporter ATP-binding protein [Clostridia bacterium]
MAGPNGGPGRRKFGPKAKDVKGSLFRLIKFLIADYKKQLIFVLICLFFGTIALTTTSIFVKNLVEIVEAGLKAGQTAEGFNAAVGFAAIKGDLITLIALMIATAVVGIAATTARERMMATVTQGFLQKMRGRMFSKMQRLPIRYFDTHTHGEIMSYYTNDIDTLRQLISQSLLSFLTCAITLLTLVSIMLYYSIWMSLVLFLGVFVMFRITKYIGGNSAKFFIRQQKSLAKAEGYVEEMMHGQKVVKVFCHEEESLAEFDRLNEQLFEDARQANRFANILMPILNNVGNLLYVLIAFVGGVLLVTKAPSLSLSGQALSIAIVIPFLNMTKQFSQNISQISQQINAVAMGLAGAERIFELLDEEVEEDNGYVTLVNAKIDEDGTIHECAERTGVWAWRHPHAADGTVTYTRLQGDVVFDDVDFGYVEDKIVLHNVSLYARPGQKVAFVGATGAGKTTITNLINRFYDIADGKIRYDGININKIRKSDLRRSLGIVLQETNLFTGTVMDNIRYGRLDATDEECIEAAKLANAHSFITRLPDGYNTMLVSDGANLSQGQRQLLSIARAAVADPPVMILDEATSSIDTRTEALVQKGMDSLMKGRTVFVIAHRLSTVQNSDVIMVLEQGRIIERGNHDALIAEKGKYYQLYTGAFELE